MCQRCSQLSQSTIVWLLVMPPLYELEPVEGEEGEIAGKLLMKYSEDYSNVFVAVIGNFFTFKL